MGGYRGRSPCGTGPQRTSSVTQWWLTPTSCPVASSWTSGPRATIHVGYFDLRNRPAVGFRAGLLQPFPSARAISRNVMGPRMNDMAQRGCTSR